MVKVLKKIVIWVVLIALAWGGWAWMKKMKNKPPEYELTPVEKGTLTYTVSADGKYLSREEADVSFRISGPISSVNVDVGSRVGVGQLLAEVDAGTLQDQLKQAQQELRAQKEVMSYQDDHDDVYSRDQRDQQADIVKKAKAAVDEITKEIGYAKMHSPMSGTIAEKSANVGELVSAGTPVLTIIRENEMRVEAKVPEVDIAGVSVGQAVSLKFDAYPDSRRFSGTVTEIDPASTMVDGVTYYVVKIHVNDPDAGFRYGMSCTMYDETIRKDDVVMVPKWAVTTKDGKKFVSIMTNEAARTVERKEVETGSEGDGGMIEVVSGLSGGERIATER